VLPADEIRKRIERYEETKAAVARAQRERTPESAAALHRVHARHLEENGDLAGADRAMERAERALALALARRGRRTA
jgi:hypothetical protein